MRAELPTGTVTFLFTDVEGSTKLWERFPDQAGPALARHDDIIEAATARYGGAVVRPRGEGDSRFCVFTRAGEAAAAALSMQRALVAEAWPFPDPLRVRIALHTGDAELRAGDYYGAAVNRCARLRGIAHGGQTLLSRATAELVADALIDGALLADLGEHVLRDIAHPERVFQLGHPDLPGEFPPLLSLDERRNNLPTELSSFIGRQNEVQTVKKLVGDARLVTLQGAAGCGKTRLALEVADELLGSFADGVWFVDLAPVADQSLVVDAVASALGVTEHTRMLVDEASPPSSGALRDRVLDHLRARDLLLLFDNCEHLIAPAAHLIEDILRLCPEVRVLATSRETLGIDPEIAWKVPSMSLPDPGDRPSLEQLSQYEACKLFVERARQRRADLDIGPEHAQAIALICRRLDGIPLAIELAAARVKLLTPVQIAERLDERFRLLVGGSRTAMERQQTLRAALDWSYDLLSEPERALFRRLGVFAGGSTLEAIEAVCDADVLDVLAQLVDKSMVEVEPGSAGIRYRMLETFRQYARENLLEAGEVADYRARHRDHYLVLAARAAPELEGRDQVEWLDRLEADHDNLRAALDWSRSEPHGRALAGLAVGLWPFWLVRGHITEGRSWCAAALEVLASGEHALRCDLLRGAAVLAWAAVDMVTATGLAEAWIEAARASGDRRRIARSLIGAGYQPRLRGDLVASREAWDQAVTIGREVGDVPTVTAALQLLAQLEAFDGNRDAAQSMLEETLALARTSGDLSAIASVCASLASHARTAGEYAAAERYLGECLELGRRLRDHTLVGQALLGMAAQARNTGNTGRARALIEEGSTMRVETMLPPQVWAVQLAKVEEAEGNFEEAERLYREMREAAERGLPGVGASALEGLARIAHRQGRTIEALVLARDSIRAWSQIGVRTGLPDSMTLVAGCLARQGRAARAARLFGAADALRASFGEVVHVTDAPGYETDIGLTRAALTPEEFEREWAAGGAMNLETAMAFALEQHPAS